MSSSRAAHPGRGHRGRLRQTFQRAGVEGLHDYQILELLLTYAIPRRDVKPIAKRLLDGFGSLSGILDARREDLQKIGGIGPRSALLLSLIKETCGAYLRHRLRGLNVLRNPRAVADYCRMALAGAPNEVVHLLLLDSRNRLIGETTLFEGTIDQSQVYPRRIIEQSLSHRASGFILVHNHPSGAVAPSADDEAMTRKLAEAARTIDLRFLDHLIVGREGEGHFSFREQGLLRDT